MKEITEMDENEIIDSYTRKEAIGDGVLIDVTEPAEEAGFKCSVAFTCALYERHVRVPDDIIDMDETGRLWDVLWLLRYAAMKSPEKSELHFKLSERMVNHKMEIVNLKAVCGPDDDGEVCLTVMLPEED
jgi:uncharacterized protein DUF6573